VPRTTASQAIHLSPGLQGQGRLARDWQVHRFDIRLRQPNVYLAEADAADVCVAIVPEVVRGFYDDAEM
jgi:hypothetical protein